MDFLAIYENNVREFKRAFDPTHNSELGDLFDSTKPNFVKIAGSWFKPKEFSEDRTRIIITKLLTECGIDLNRLIPEFQLKSKGGIFAIGSGNETRIIKYPDYCIENASFEKGVHKHLLLEIEPIRKDLGSEPDSGLQQVGVWYKTIPDLDADYDAISTNFVDWFLITRPSTGNGMSVIQKKPAEILEIVLEVYLGQEKKSTKVPIQFSPIQKFYREFQKRLDQILDIDGVQNIKVLNLPPVSLEEKKDIAVCYYRTIFTRLMFIKILEQWRLLDFDPIKYVFDSVKENDYYSNFEVLFFDVFNVEKNRIPGLLKKFYDLPYLNGGLFRQMDLERKYIRLSLSSASFKDIWNLLCNFQFMHAEDPMALPDRDFANAVYPEILGYIFEKTIGEDRRATGSYYTKGVITEFIIRNTIHKRLVDLINNWIKIENTKAEDEGKTPILPQNILSMNLQVWKKDIRDILCEELLKILDKIRICDNACGSGAFLEMAAKQLLQLYADAYTELGYDLPDLDKKARESPDPTDKRPFRDKYSLKMHILQNNVYGVDIMPNAVDLCQLRLWLWLSKPPENRLKVEKDKKAPIEPLPNIDFNILCGNSVVGYIKDPPDLQDFIDEKSLREIRKKRIFLINEYKSNDAEHERIYTEIMVIENQLRDVFNRSLHHALTGVGAKGSSILKGKKKEDISYPDFQKMKPFHWSFEFEEVLKEGGFDIIAGNPPYIKDVKNRAAFDGLMNSPYYKGKSDIWYIFACRSFEILKEQGYLSYIAQNNWITSEGASILRETIMTNATMTLFYDFHNYQVFEDVSNQVMIFIAKNEKITKKFSVQYGKLLAEKISEEDLNHFLYGTTGSFFVKYSTEFIRDEHSSWKKTIDFLTPDIVLILEKIRTAPSVLTLDKKEIAQGLVCPQDNLNEKNAEILRSKYGTNLPVGAGIFILSIAEKDSLKPTPLEIKNLIRPLFTSNELQRYFANPTNKYWVIYTDSGIKNTIQQYPHIKAHLDKFAPIITSAYKPYGLHRARVEKIFKGSKVIVTRKCKDPIFTYVNFDAYVTQTFNIIRTTRFNRKYLTVLLNSSIIRFWLHLKGKRQGSIYQLDIEPLMRIPLVLPDRSTQERIAKSLDAIVDIMQATDYPSNVVLQQQVSDIERQLDEDFQFLYGLTPEEMQTMWSKIVEGEIERSGEEEDGAGEREDEVE